MNRLRPYILIFVVFLILIAIYLLNFLDSNNSGSREIINIQPRLDVENKAQKYELAKEITSPDGFVNTSLTGSGQAQPITIGEFIGKKVVLVDFWTYSCINCQRTIPYLNSWYEKYKDKGLVVIGIHTPEFEFEKDYENVKRATEKFQIDYPVVLDNDYSTWFAYKNRYWPRKYLIDIDGYIIYDHIGEGAYEETEKKIQKALSERMAVLKESDHIDQPLTKETLTQKGIGSPETYFGSLGNEFLANGNKGVPGIQNNLALPSIVNQNSLYLSDDWNFAGEFATNNSINAQILYKYTAKEVFFVAEANEETIIEILYDDKPLDSNSGEDVIETEDGKTVVKIKEPRLYKLIKSNILETHTLKIIIQKPGLKAFTFTFG